MARPPTNALLKALAQRRRRHGPPEPDLAEDERLRAEGYHVTRIGDLVIVIAPGPRQDGS